MTEYNQNRTYVNMMVDVLQRKRAILEQLLEDTREQERLLLNEKMDVDAFNALVESKGTQIEELNEIDEGFDALFQRVKSEIVSHRENYRSQIETMQSLIAEVSSLGVSVQALEQQNCERFKAFLARERQGIRDFHVNNRMASAYYQNMPNIHRDNQSYFLNEKK